MQMDESKTKEYIKKYWDESSKRYDQKSAHGIQTQEERAAWTRAFEAMLPRGRRLNVLDVGCGTGELSYVLADMGHNVFGIDLSEEMLKKAREKGKKLGLNAKFAAGDAEKLNFDDASFDMVYNRHLLWTLPHPEKAIHEWKRVLAKDGLVNLIDGDWRNSSIDSRLRRLVSGMGVLLFKRRNPWKGWYAEEVRSSLPHPYGIPSTKAREYLEKAGFEDIKVMELKEIRAIHRREAPAWERIAYNWPYYMISGSK